MSAHDTAPPFPSDLDPGTARRQAGALLALFYAIVYGSPALLVATPYRMAVPMLSALFIGGLMLMATWVFVRRDASWHESLGLDRQPLGRTVGWSLLGFLCTYAVNIVLTMAYVATRGGVEGMLTRRMSWLGVLAELPVEAILPLATFVAVWEEIVFRGFLLGRLRASLPLQDSRAPGLRRDALAVTLSALFFGAGHGYQGLLGILQTTAAGLVLGTLVVRRRSLWPAIGAHLIIDAFGLVAIQLAKHLLHTP